ncbi:MAG TPA: sigma 54-interacting transcriptional regulator, partial [Gemmatimonadaceae bacterium]|nr:sigma 54-interacting transcriptional regulator [Gemmatimonadaceae bacterium]
MARVRELVRQIAPTELSVLIEGPTGAGKELVAQAMHAASRRSGRLVAFNVCAIAETMFEDALFGHVRGAFTGATSDAAGYLVEADKGTVFLDEISGLAMGMQAKLLRVLETREFRPVGARLDRRSDFRVVAATNEPLATLLAERRIRADLAYRLGGVVIQVPSLRERPEDVPVLACRFMERARASCGIAVRLSGEALHALQQYDWPGNVRELKNVVERAAVLAEGAVVTGLRRCREARALEHRVGRRGLDRECVPVRGVAGLRGERTAHTCGSCGSVHPPRRPALGAGARHDGVLAGRLRRSAEDRKRAWSDHEAQPARYAVAGAGHAARARERRGDAGRVRHAGAAEQDDRDEPARR